MADPPGAPGVVSFSNVLPQSVTVSWGAATPGSGSVIAYYVLTATDHADSTSYTWNVQGLMFNITTFVKPGHTYTFSVYAQQNFGGAVSGPTSESDLQMPAGAWIRVDGVWKVAIPYARTGGVWKMALPHIRVAGNWKATH